MSSAASLKMKRSISPGFIVISEIKPVKDESTVEAAPDQVSPAALDHQNPGCQKNGRSNDDGLLTCNPSI